MTCLLRNLATAAAVASALHATAAPDASCAVRARGPAPTVVELYTSEGCSSCPPAEAWLNQLKARTDVLAMAFHVSYWDHLGWPDRFASTDATDRQRQLARLDGLRGVHTPQVRAAGVDWPHWPVLPPSATTAGPALDLSRDGDGFVAQVEAHAGHTLSGYWVVLEDRHESRVRAGENNGSTLRHDHVVRLYRPVSAWPASQAFRSRLAVSRGVDAHPRRVAFVVVDAARQRPLQAAVLGC